MTTHPQCKKGETYKTTRTKKHQFTNRQLGQIRWHGTEHKHKKGNLGVE